MTIIKLDAIDSTNDYLKQLSKDKVLENYTIVMANEQTNGKGQLGAKWQSEPGKNLLMSVLVKDLPLDLISVFDLNAAVAIAAINTLSMSCYPKGKIKWPNDIMAENKKVGGILVENSFKPNGTFNAIIGFGLNLNQTNFENLPNASSMITITGKEWDLEETAKLFVKMLKMQMMLLPEKTKALWADYNSFLFKRSKAVAFEDKNGKRFMAIVKKVTTDGKLALLQNDDKIHHYEVKEIKMLF
jgi:BirA family transcriptional regulator, biotin operon repressor / biotin---[acetyl-CoA-carboxylase] ligase